MTATKITIQELTEADTIVMNPDARPAHVIREESLSITRQKYGITYTALHVVDGRPNGRRRGALRYTDTVWVTR